MDTVSPLFVPTVAKIVSPAAYLGEDAVRLQQAEVPLELIGVERPFTEQDRRRFDRALGIDDAVVVR